MEGAAYPPSRRASIAIAAALAVAAAPLFLRFAGHGGIASVGDDSVSYLTLARFLAGDAGPYLIRWVGFQSNFPPLFPLALAIGGGAADLAMAHRVVALFAVAGIVLLQRYAAARLRSDRAGLAIALAFLATPTAWISTKGILSEPMYLFVSLAALHFHARRIEGRDTRPADALAFGALVAAAMLTRAAGVALLAAYVLQVAWSALVHRSRPPRPALLVLIVAVASQLLWLVLRPAGADAYARTGSGMIASWIERPALMLGIGAPAFLDGWIASFASDADVPFAMRVVFTALGAVALAGSARAALTGRLDGWYALVATAILFGWVFGVENTRRLFYPLVPILLLHAAEMACLAASRLHSVQRWILAGAVALPVLLCLPALAVAWEKSFDTAPLPGSGGRSLADMSDYYIVVNRSHAAALAAKDIAVIAGLEALARVTPRGSRVMWMRPEYVALLGQRPAAACFYAWDARRLAEEIRRSGTDYIVMASMYKSDLLGKSGDPNRAFSSVVAYTRPVYVARNAITGGDELVLRQVDGAALERALASTGR